MDKSSNDEFMELLVNFPAVLDVGDVKEILRIGRDSAYKVMKAKDFPSIKIGNQYRVTKPNFIKYLEQERA